MPNTTAFHINLNEALTSVDTPVIVLVVENDYHPDVFERLEQRARQDDLYRLPGVDAYRYVPLPESE